MKTWWTSVLTENNGATRLSREQACLNQLSTTTKSSSWKERGVDAKRTMYQCCYVTFGAYEAALHDTFY